ncbi:hypothetical protein DSL72_007966 [Monilinia vaccinii-corymbosi]|uniref:Uncharacterized protein n=1 Tax=Monilinia vaccinii-corymbosi TaxID=61207 RepID=A0A8A3PIJ8_9HELO|nr:hypothetical protein DSL72_007966 [Monilinia vaccinii-corymbosi]
MAGFEGMVSRLRNWAFPSTEGSGSNEKLLPSATSSSLASIDEEEYSPSPQVKSKPRSYHKLFFMPGLTSIVILGAVTLTILTRDSHSGVVPNTPPPPALGGNKVVAHCGISPEEAIERGCVWDIMTYGWIHPLCFNKEESDQFFAQYGPFEWFADDKPAVDKYGFPLNGTLTRPLTLEELPFTPSIYTTQGYHISHCMYILKLVHLAALHNIPVTNEGANIGHTDHCASLVGNSDLVPYGKITSKVNLLYVQCVTLR